MAEITTNIFIFWNLVMFAAFYITFPKGSQWKEVDIRPLNIFAGLVATILSIIHSKMILNQQVVETMEYTSPIISPAYSQLYLFFAFIAGGLTLLVLVMYLKENLEREVRYV